MHPEMGAGEGSEQPGPHSAHMVGGIARPWIAGIGSKVFWIARAQSAQPVAGQKIPAASLDHRAHLGGRQRAVGQGDRENLIGPDRIIVGTVVIYDVIETLAFLVPEAAKAAARAGQQRLTKTLLAQIVHAAGGSKHDVQRIEPERVHLDRLAEAPRGYPIAILGIHPRPVRPPFTGAPA